MLTGFKVRIHPTKKQVESFYQYAGTTRFMYNWAIATIKEAHENGVKFKDVKLANQLTVIQKEVEGFTWLSNIPRKVKTTAIENAEDAMIRFFKKESKFPRFKTRKNSKIKFNFTSEGNKPKNGYITVPKIGKVKIHEKDRIAKEIDGAKLATRLGISFDGKFWYLSGAYEKDFEQFGIEADSLGVDLGLKELATTSDAKYYKNINKSNKVRKLNKKIKQKQRQLSRKYEINKDGNKFIKTNNISKLLVEIKNLHRELNNIRDAHIQQITSEMVKTKPKRIVMEDLNVSGMMKNRHLSKAIGEVKWYYFIETLRWKCKKFGIEFIQVDRFYASSKTCSSCGSKKSDLKLKDRMYICECGLEIDRDLNASINLANYTN